MKLSGVALTGRRPTWGPGGERGERAGEENRKKKKGLLRSKLNVGKMGKSNIKSTGAESSCLRGTGESP